MLSRKPFPLYVVPGYERSSTWIKSCFHLSWIQLKYWTYCLCFHLPSHDSQGLLFEKAFDESTSYGLGSNRVFKAIRTWWHWQVVDGVIAAAIITKFEIGEIFFCLYVRMCTINWSGFSFVASIYGGDAMTSSFDGSLPKNEKLTIQSINLQLLLCTLHT